MPKQQSFKEAAAARTRRGREDGPAIVNGSPVEEPDVGVPTARQALDEAHQGVIKTLLRCLENYYPEPNADDGFSYLLGQTLNRIDRPEDLAALVGCSTQTLGRWARGLGLPPIITRVATIAALAEIVRDNFEVPTLPAARNRALDSARRAVAAQIRDPA